MADKDNQSSPEHELLSLKEKYNNLKQKMQTRCTKCQRTDFHQLLMKSDIAAVVLDHDGNIIYANDAFSRITGYMIEEAAGCCLCDIFKMNTASALSEILLNENNHTSFQTSFFNKKEQEIWINLSTSKFTTSKNDSSKKLCVFSDITTEMELENRKQQLLEELLEVQEVQEENSAKLAELLHELNEKNVQLEKEINQKELMQKQLLQREEELHKLSITDQLTGLYNRHHLQVVAKNELTLCHFHKTNLSIVLIDIDDFKKLNDEMGHLVGDYVLREFGSMLLNICKDKAKAFRYGGEEFILILKEYDLDKAVQFAEVIRTKLSQYKFSTYDESDFTKTISIGVAQLKDKETFDQIVKRADKNLYLSKKEGKNCISCKY